MLFEICLKAELCYIGKECGHIFQHSTKLRVNFTSPSQN